MNYRKIFIIRHGETDYNREHKMQGRGINAPLNDTGRNQAEAVADYLERYHLKHVVSSSMLRAKQSAAPLIMRNGASLMFHKDLDEMNFGDFEGKKYREIDRQVQVLQQRWISGDTSYRIPGGESPGEVFKRAGNRASLYLKEFDGADVAFFIHGRVIRILLSEWTGIGLKNMHQISHANGAINQLRWNGSNFDVVYLNKTDHLTEFAS